MDVATLGLRLDANGYVAGANTVVQTNERMGASTTKLQSKIQNFATAGAFALGSLASGGARDLTTLGRSLSGLGFAFGPMVGTITLAVASIGLAFAESRKQAKEEMDKMLRDFQGLESGFSLAAKKGRIAILEAREAQIQDGIMTMPFRMGRSLEDGRLLNRLAEEGSLVSGRLGGLRNAVAKEEADNRTKEAKKAADDATKAYEDMALAIRQSRDELDKWAVSFYENMVGNEAIASGFAEMARGQGPGLSNPMSPFQMDFSASLNLDLLMQRVADEEAKKKARQDQLEQIAQGAVMGFGGGILSGIGGPLGGAASGVVAGVGGGPMGMALGGVQGLVSSLINLGQSSSQAREAMLQFMNAQQAFIDQLKVGAGVLGETEADRRERERTLAEKERSTRAQLGMFGAGFDPNNPFAQAGITQFFSKEFLEQIAQQLRDMEMYGPAWIDAITKHTDALNTTTRNNPSGFYVESYLGEHADRSGIPNGGGMGGRGPNGNRNDGTTRSINIETATFQLPAGSSAEQVRAFVKALDQFAASMGGAGSSRSNALDALPA